YPEIPGKSVRHLTEKGIVEVRATAQMLAGEAIDVIISSPMTRTVETATLISEATGIPVAQDIRLRETDFGKFNMGSIERFFQAYPEPSKRVETSGDDGLESIEGMRGRVESILHDIAKEYTGKKVVLVSHADTLEQIYGFLRDEGVVMSLRGWSPKTASCTKVVWEYK
ncbi:MAG: histidine phosphatase family protein, partial [Patescibacteria group bacterium]